MTSKFEQLIEYVINDEEAKAKELFHDIVVEKSREIYENLMNEEECDDEEEAEESEEVEESVEADLDESEEDLMNDVEMEEEGISMEDESDAEFDDAAENDGEELTHDMEKDHDEGEDLEDRVVDLEDKLDELMAEFESLMGSEEAEHGIDSDLAGEEGDEVEGDALAADDTMAFAEAEELDENISLAAAPKPVTAEPAGTNTKSTVAFNSGAAGMEGAPVKATGTEAKGRPAPSTQAVSSDKFQNTPASGSKKLSPATKPVTTQAAGVNTKTPFPKG